MEGMIEFTTMNELHIGHCMIIKEKPCKITELNISKTGKHGCAKAVVTGKDIFTDKKYTCTFATSDKVQVPVIKTLAYQLNNIDDGYMDLMDENNDTVSHMKLKWGTDVESALLKAFEEGKPLEVKVMIAMNEYKVVSFSELK